MYENMYEKMIAVTNRHLVLENDTDGAYLKQLTYVASLHPKAMVLREKDLTEWIEVPRSVSPSGRPIVLSISKGRCSLSYPK